MSCRSHHQNSHVSTVRAIVHATHRMYPKPSSKRRTDLKPHDLGHVWLTPHLYRQATFCCCALKSFREL